MMSDTQSLATRLRDKAAAGHAIVAAGAGIGLSAKCAADAGVDLIVVYNSGRYRMAGRGSTSGYLPFGDGNQIVFDMAGEIIPMAAGIPVLAGVCGTDPFRIMTVYLQELLRVGYAGVQNFPTVGLIDGRFRQSLEETGLGYGLEVEMIAAAHRLGMLTAPYVFTPDEGRAMAEAGADLVVAHMGVTVKGMIGAQTAMSIEEAAERVQADPGSCGRRAARGLGALPRRPDRGAVGRRIRPRTHLGRRRILRSQQHGAAADGDSHDRAHPRVHRTPVDSSLVAPNRRGLTYEQLD